MAQERHEDCTSPWRVAEAQSSSPCSEVQLQVQTHDCSGMVAPASVSPGSSVTQYELSTCIRSLSHPPGQGQADSRSRSSRRVRIVCGAGALLCCLVALELLIWDEDSGAGRARTSALEQAPPGNTALAGKALQAVKAMYRQDPAFVKDWAMLTGREGQKLLDEIHGPPPPPKQVNRPEQALAKLDKDMQKLDDTAEVVEDSNSEEGDEKEQKALDLSLPEVNQRAAYMLVRDLSKDWDVHSNYSTTPWEFCPRAGRDLSKRQISECTEHLMSTVGVKAHRDLNLNAKIYDRFCTGFEHTYFDKYGSPMPLPRDAAARCVKVVTARGNVDELLKRQVTQHQWHKDPKTGAILPPKAEIQGSHGIPCSDMPEGCR